MCKYVAGNMSEFTWAKYITNGQPSETPRAFIQVS